MPAFEATGGMPYWIDLTTSDVRKSTHFYAQLLDWEIDSRDDSDYRIARVQGLPVAGFIPQPEEGGAFPDTWITYFLADDIDAQVKQIERLGGRVLAAPTAVGIGRMSLLIDAAGALFGLIEPAGEDYFIAAGEPGTPVWHELTATAGFEDAVDFYHGLLDWELVAQATGEDFTYTTAVAEGAPFAGIWKAEGQFPPQVPSFWQSYLGIVDLDDAVTRVPELGGEIIREPWDSEFGRMCIIADPTGATVTLAEVEAYVEEDIRESDPLQDVEF